MDKVNETESESEYLKKYTSAAQPIITPNIPNHATKKQQQICVQINTTLIVLQIRENYIKNNL